MRKRRLIVDPDTAKYTEWCPYCDAETDYNKDWEYVKCSGCGRLLMPCDWCAMVLRSCSSDSGRGGWCLCAEKAPEGFSCVIEADVRFKSNKNRRTK